MEEIEVQALNFKIRVKDNFQEDVYVIIFLIEKIIIYLIYLYIIQVNSYEEIV